MRISLLSIFTSFFLLHLSAQDKTSVNIPEDEIINQMLIENNVPTMAIGIIEQGKIRALKMYGSIQGDTTAPTNTIFDVASLTKTITTLITLELVSEEEWDLDEPLSRYWIDPDVKDDPLHRKLTTRHVLSHRTGFKNWRWMNEDKKLAFEFEPGSNFQYSGEGFEYLRRALEKKFEKSFEALADSLVFVPNQMNNSYLVWNDELDIEHFAETHDEAGKQYEYEKSFQSNAADNLLTTIEDFTSLGMNIMNGHALDQAMYQEMISPQSVVREGINFGLGWILFKDLSNDEYALFNAGSDQGINALIVLLPKSKRGLVVMTNGDNGRALVMKTIALTLSEVGGEILGRF